MKDLVSDKHHSRLTLIPPLSQKGANPYIKDCWSISDAFGYAKLGNKNVLSVLDEWKDEREMS